MRSLIQSIFSRSLTLATGLVFCCQSIAVVEALIVVAFRFVASPKPMTLQEVCRVVVRRILRKNIQLEYPSLGRGGAAAKRRPPRPRRPRRCERRRRINFIPMQAGLMIVGQFPPMDSDDENAEHGLGTDDDDHNATMSDGEIGDADGSPSESSFLRPLFWRSPANFLRNDSATEDDVTFEAEPEEDREVRMENGVAYKDREITDSDSDDEVGAAANIVATETAESATSNTASEAIVIHTSEPSSANSYSTSYSSGIGTCSSLGAESESGNGTDIAGSEDLLKNGTTAAGDQDGFFDDDTFGIDLSSVSALKALCQSRNGTEDHRGERMEDIVEVQEEACIAAEANEGECLPEEPAEADPDPIPGITFRSCMREKIELLPVPAALKDYLMFYRK